MKFAIGYRDAPGGEPFSAVVTDYREAVTEVYFSWSGQPSGRPNAPATDWGAQERLENELRKIRRLGVKLDLLFNANCYGADAVSEKLEREVCGILERLDSLGLLPEIVTTASVFIAELLREAAPGIERRASVNMRLDSLSALDYLDGRFDSFYIRRDIQRNLGRVREFADRCRERGWKLCMLANSGCLRNCPAQTFHDNFVAHSAEAATRRTSPEHSDPTICWPYYRDPVRRIEFLKGSWIRPEDIRCYEGLVDVVKLATRQHDRPRMVIGAYASGRFDGNLTMLMEPNFSSLFGRESWIDNRRFPDDWFGTAADCATDCRHCGRCEKVWRQVAGTSAHA